MDDLWLRTNKPIAAELVVLVGIVGLVFCKRRNLFHRTLTVLDVRFELLDLGSDILELREVVGYLLITLV